MPPRLITPLLASALPTTALLAAAPGAAAPPDTPTPRPTIGLALGSGGANGLAHIAILQVFDDLGSVPDRIVGTSIGAVIGGLYAAGLPAEAIRDIFDDVAGSPLDALSGLAESEVELSALVPFGRDDAGLLNSAGFLHFLAGHTEVRTFDEPRIPLEVVATDYWTGVERAAKSRHRAVHLCPGPAPTYRPGDRPAPRSSGSLPTRSPWPPWA